MQKSGGVVIHMQQSSDNINMPYCNSAKYEHPSLQYKIGNSSVVAAMETIQPLQPFADCTLNFFNALSKILLKTGREYSDVVTFGFWCRRASLMTEKQKYDDISNRMGKGVAFHSTPSNVPVNFAFSFAAGLLAGNANIVRIPGKSFEQVEIICTAIKELLENDHSEMSPYIVFVKYPPVKEITDSFSLISNTRIIWGGDGTIAEIRQSPLRPRANEITFADRHSFAVIDADGYLQIEDKKKTAQDFYNDTYFSDQNACTSPRVVVWLGCEKARAKSEFWRHVHTYVKETYKIEPVQTIGKLAAFYRTASQIDVNMVSDDSVNEDQLITRIKTKNLDGLMKFKYNSGFFFEYDAESINEIAPLCDERCQTLTYCGMPPHILHDFIAQQRPRGVDRIVPMGKSMEFSLIWDGHDLIREMSRHVSIV